MFSIFTHVMSRDTHSEPGLPVLQGATPLSICIPFSQKMYPIHRPSIEEKYHCHILS